MHSESGDVESIKVYVYVYWRKRESMLYILLLKVSLKLFSIFAFIKCDLRVKNITRIFVQFIHTMNSVVNIQFIYMLLVDKLIQLARV